MIAFTSTLMPEYGAGVVALTVLTYAVSITATMSLIGAGIGSAVRVTDNTHLASGVLRAAGGVLVVGLAIAMLLRAAPTIV